MRSDVPIVKAFELWRRPGQDREHHAGRKQANADWSGQQNPPFLRGCRPVHENRRGRQAGGMPQWPTAERRVQRGQEGQMSIHREEDDHAKHFDDLRHHCRRVVRGWIDQGRDGQAKLLTKVLTRDAHRHEK